MKLLRFCFKSLGAVGLILTAACAPNPNVLALDGSNPASLSGPTAAGVDLKQTGHTLMDAGEYELALKAYFRAAANEGLTPEILSSIGTANLGLDRLGQAERALRQALEEDDTYVPAWNNLGIVLHARGKIGESREAFRVAFALDNGASSEIRDNLRLLDQLLENVLPVTPEPSDFRLVRQGGGVYSLISNDPAEVEEPSETTEDTVADTNDDTTEQ